VDEAYAIRRTRRDLPLFAESMGHDQYFVMGDNRPQAIDSRRFGPISEDEISSLVVWRIGHRAGATRVPDLGS
jgi:type IV secretory pathway protease TraF